MRGFLGFILIGVLFGASLPVFGTGRIYFPGSFSPPTLEHMASLIRVARSQNILKATIVVTRPYKPEEYPAPAEINAKLTRLAVDQIEEVLRIESIPFVRVEKISPGHVIIHKKDGRTLEIDVDDRDVKQANGVHYANAADRLPLLQQIQLEKGDTPQESYFLFGAESFEKIPTWTTDWKKFFDLGNFLIVPQRSELTSHTTIDFTQGHPLQKMLPPDFLMEFTYVPNAALSEHTYSRGPLRIQLIFEPIRDGSSDQARKDLQFAHAQSNALQLLQPAVFLAALKDPHFGKNKMTRENLEIFLKNIRQKIQRGDATPEEIQSFDRFSKDLLRILLDLSAEAKKDSRAKKTLYFFVETVLEKIEDIKSFRSWTAFQAMAKSLMMKFGLPLTVAFIAGEILEKTALPVLLHAIGGTKALALLPFIHAEYFILTTWALTKIVQSKIRKKKLAGDTKTYRQVKDYQNRLLRGDPDAIISHIVLPNERGLSGEALGLNIVKSNLHRWIPLAVRNWFDKKIVWHDLNVSTNELRAILSDSDLANEIDESAESSAGLRAELMMEAILAKPETLARFQVFLHRRNFVQLFAGPSPEIRQGFGPELNAIVTKLDVARSKLVRKLRPEQVRKLVEYLSLLYAYTRSGSWKEVEAQYVRFYPDNRGNKLSAAQREELLFIRSLVQRHLDPNFSIHSVEDISLNQVRVSAIDFVDEFSEIFDMIHSLPTSVSMIVTPILSRNPSSYTNILWEYSKIYSNMKMRFDEVRQSIDRQMSRVDIFPHEAAAKKVLWRKIHLIERNFRKALKTQEELHFDWAIKRLSQDSGLSEKNEAEFDGHQEAREAYERLKSQLKSYLSELDSIRNYLSEGAPDRFLNVQKSCPVFLSLVPAQ